MYSIVDIETTSNGIQGNKITEISIFKFDGREIIEEFTSLVNPQCPIATFITGLTGIDNDMVRHAPKLEDIATRILEITQDTIFVAHNVNFDYRVIKHEFETIGIPFSRRKLCTVRLSRKLIPGYNSYSLGKLCSSLNIPLTNRHRARGDAHATVLLLQHLLQTKNAETVFDTFLNARSQQATLPPSLPMEVFEKLPNLPGVYYFKNNQGEIIYIGKAIDIKKRVLGHFYNKANKEIRLCQETHDIGFELSGNELIALLMESAAIKKHFPKYNRSQKNNAQEYGIFTYEDRNGIFHLAYNRLKLIPNPLLSFPHITECRLFLEQLCQDFELCPKYCHLQENTSSCSHYKISSCAGICKGEESISEYNKKVKDAIVGITSNLQNICIKEKGRHADEEAFILISNGLYKGYGFVPKDHSVQTIEELNPYIAPQKDNRDIKNIIATYLRKYPSKNII
ncbi:GIY-YIG nuclease family protein [Arenibacter sp. 6A1]|uniref:exonuclease domain-containing protein n=1 Tax=Arenibacter sp. 6A1 TaxID=2720391 RepID=UPI00144535DA|nr:exonuclease domain-containing protein [Arenibacter sp. 6A1]NKI28000.1 GIY-YIG nuclease family protein [Arenibacter sp. 6A1]